MMALVSQVKGSLYLPCNTSSEIAFTTEHFSTNTRPSTRAQPARRPYPRFTSRILSKIWIVAEAVRNPG